MNVLNSDLNNRNDVTDLLAEADVGINSKRIVNCGANTLNTPFKAGLTNAAQGTAYINMANENYGTVIYVANSGYEIFLRKKGSGVWDPNWYKLLTNADLEVNNITSGFITGASSITAKIARFGPLFLLDINVNLPAMSEANDNTVILTLAEGYRPRYTVELSLSSSLPQANGKLLRAFLNPNGTLSIWHTEATPQQFTFIHGTWIK